MLVGKGDDSRTLQWHTLRTNERVNVSSKPSDIDLPCSCMTKLPFGNFKVLSLSTDLPFISPLFGFQYADPVANLLDKWGVFRARLFRESCVFHRGNYVKDLSRLGRDLHKVVIMDNSPASYIFHPDNAVSDIFVFKYFFLPITCFTI